ncbi:MAG: rhodanese-related sulfurtransferase [Planctomycetota bacterium]|jgi:rhodanese-related sulfurtransferase
MQYLTLALALAAFLLALILWGRAAAQGIRIDDLETEVRRTANAAREAMTHELDTLKTLLARVAAGEKVTADQIEEGRLWAEVTATQAKEMTDGNDVLTIDVRTAAECATGTIPGALQIPVEELESRYKEIPKDKRRKLLVCAMGVRSAAACDFLTSKGYGQLLNLEGGMSAWTGPTERA